MWRLRRSNHHSLQACHLGILMVNGLLAIRTYISVHRPTLVCGRAVLKKPDFFWKGQPPATTNLSLFSFLVFWSSFFCHHLCAILCWPMPDRFMYIGCPTFDKRSLISFVLPIHALASRGNSIFSTAKVTEQGMSEALNDGIASNDSKEIPFTSLHVKRTEYMDKQCTVHINIPCTTYISALRQFVRNSLFICTNTGLRISQVICSESLNTIHRKMRNLLLS